MHALCAACDTSPMVKRRVMQNQHVQRAALFASECNSVSPSSICHLGRGFGRQRASQWEPVGYILLPIAYKNREQSKQKAEQMHETRGTSMKKEPPEP
jgi:hypothetical protein